MPIYKWLLILHDNGYLTDDELNLLFDIENNHDCIIFSSRTDNINSCHCFNFTFHRYNFNSVSARLSFNISKLYERMRLKSSEITELFENSINQ